MKLIYASWVSIGGRSIFSVDVHPDGSRFATGGQGEDSTGKVVIWNMAPVVYGLRRNNGDATNDKHVEQQPKQPPLVLCEMKQHLGCVNCVRWSHAGRYLASCSDDKLVMVWHLARAGAGGGHTVFGGNTVNVEHWKVAATLRGHSQDVLHVAWSPHDTHLATCGVDNTVIVWDARKFSTGNADQIRVIRKHTSFVKGVAWDPVGKYLASQSDDKTLRIFNTEEWKEVECVEAPFEECGGTTHVLRLDWSPLGDVLVSAHALNNNGSTAQIITRSNWSTKLDYVGHRKAVTCVRFHPKPFKLDNSKQKCQMYSCIAVGSKDKGISVWATCRSRPLVVLGKAFKEPVMDLSWNPRGLGFLACSLDGRCMYGEFSVDEIGRPCSQEELSEYFEQNYKLSAMNGLDMTAISEFHGGADGGGKMRKLFPTSAHDLELAERRVKESAGVSKAATPGESKKPVQTVRTGPSRQSEVQLADGRRRITPLFIPPSVGEDGDMPAPFGSDQQGLVFSASTPVVTSTPITAVTPVPTTANTNLTVTTPPTTLPTPVPGPVTTTATTPVPTTSSSPVATTSSSTATNTTSRGKPMELMAARMVNPKAQDGPQKLETAVTSKKSKPVDSTKKEKKAEKLSIKSFLKKEEYGGKSSKGKSELKRSKGENADSDMETNDRQYAAKKKRRSTVIMSDEEDNDDVDDTKVASVVDQVSAGASGSQTSHPVPTAANGDIGVVATTVPKVKKEVVFECDITGTPHVVTCCNVAAGGLSHAPSRASSQCKVTLMKKRCRTRVWSRGVSHAVVHVVCNDRACCVACDAGVFYILSTVNGELVSPLHALPYGIAMVSMYGGYVALLTAPPHSTVYPWRISDKGGASLLSQGATLPYVATRPPLTITRLMVSDDGLVVVGISSGENWAYLPAHGSWSFLCRSVGKPRLTTVSLLTAPVTLAMLRGGVIPGADDPRHLVDGVGLEELEEQLQAAILLRSKAEYLLILRSYVTTLIQRGEADMLASVYRSLLEAGDTEVLDVVEDGPHVLQHRNYLIPHSLMGIDTYPLLSDLLILHKQQGGLLELHRQYLAIVARKK